MLQKVRKMMEELNMVSSQDLILVGVSGGADSVCLLLALKELEAAFGYSLEAVHVEHGIRGAESLRDQQFVADLCAKWRVPLTEVSVDAPEYSKSHGVGLEEAARELRYDVFSRIAKDKKAKVALAHHMEDNAETILFQMLRGSALTGLCGMQPVRKDEKGVEYIRPLLRIHRKEIEEELAARGVDYCIDSTNQELEYSRNYLRNVVLPQLCRVNEQAVAHINGTANHLRDVKDFLEQETKKAWGQVATQYAPVNAVKQQEFVQVLDVAALTKLHPALQKEVVLKAISSVCGSRKDISAVHVDDVLALCGKQSGKEVRLPYQVVAKRDFNALHIYGCASCNQERDTNAVVSISAAELEDCRIAGRVLEVPLGAKELLRIKVFSHIGQMREIPKKTYTKWMDYDKIKQGFCIRTRRSGDYFIGDMFGHHKKLKEYFIDEKISATERSRMWLLAQESLVLWLIGGRISEHIKVTEETQTIVEIEYIGGK